MQSGDHVTPGGSPQALGAGILATLSLEILIIIAVCALLLLLVPVIVTFICICYRRRHVYTPVSYTYCVDIKACLNFEQCVFALHTPACGVFSHLMATIFISFVPKLVNRKKSFVFKMIE